MATTDNRPTMTTGGGGVLLIGFGRYNLFPNKRRIVNKQRPDRSTAGGEGKACDITRQGLR